MLKIKGILDQNNIASKVIVLLGITCFTTLSSVLLWKICTDGNSTNINSLKMLQLFQSIGLFILPPFVLAYLCYEKPLQALHLNKKTPVTTIALVVFFMVLIIPVINLLTEWNQQLVLPAALSELEQWMRTAESQTAALTEKMVQVHGIEALLYNLFLMALLPAIGEELFFRGTVQGFFTKRKNAHGAIWITAFIFSTIHFQFYGFLPRFLLGAFFGYLLLKSGSLWLPIIGHFVNNAMAVIFYYLKYNGYQVFDIDKIGTANTLWVSIMVFSLIVSASLLLWRKSAQV
jgi:membrane protease YdiL (CAAX protease family)